MEMSRQEESIHELANHIFFISRSPTEKVTDVEILFCHLISLYKLFRVMKQYWLKISEI